MTLAELLRHGGYAKESQELLAPFRDAEAGLEPVIRARALLSLGMNLMFDGQSAEGGLVIERALSAMEDSLDWSGLADGLTTRGVYLIASRRLQEGLGVLRQALAIAEAHDLPALALRAHYNIAGLHLDDQRLSETLSQVTSGLALAQERGDRSWDLALRSQAIPPLTILGRWEEVLRDGLPLLESSDLFAAASSALFVAWVASARGDDDLVDRCAAAARRCSESQNLEVRGSATIAMGAHALIRGDAATASELAARGSENIYAGEMQAEALRIRTEAAMALGDVAAMEELAAHVEQLPPARKLPLPRACRARLRAELGHLSGDAERARQLEHEAEDTLRALQVRPLLATALLDRVRRHGDELALAEARQILEDLQATRWLEQLSELAPAR